MSDENYNDLRSKFLNTFGENSVAEIVGFLFSQLHFIGMSNEKVRYVVWENAIFLAEKLKEAGIKEIH